jgi:hypothetical protein
MIVIHKDRVHKGVENQDYLDKVQKMFLQTL